MVDKRLKYILYFLMLISLFLTIKNKVHAQTITSEYNPTGFFSQTIGSTTWENKSNTKQNKNIGGTVFRTIVPSYSMQAIMYEYGLPNGNGTLSFSVYIDNALDEPFTAIITTNGGTKITCNQTQMQTVAQYHFINYYCQGYTKGASGYNSLTFYGTPRYQYEQVQAFGISNFMTLYTEQDASNVVNAINNQTNSINNVNNSIQDTNNTLKDSSTDNQKAQDTFDNLNSNMATNSTISDLLLMPIHLLQKVLNGLQGSCSAINLGELLGTDFILPCIDISDIIGSTLWNIIDVICSGFLAYHIGKRFVVIFNQFTNLKEGGLESAYD